MWDKFIVISDGYAHHDIGCGPFFFLVGYIIGCKMYLRHPLHTVKSAHVHKLVVAYCMINSLYSVAFTLC